MLDGARMAFVFPFVYHGSSKKKSCVFILNIFSNSTDSGGGGSYCLGFPWRL
jgi:hypothetical protein